jgi:hypothetical protein
MGEVLNSPVSAFVPTLKLHASDNACDRSDTWTGTGSESKQDRAGTETFGARME